MEPVSEIDRIQKNGPQIIVYGDLWPNGMICIPYGAYGWIPQKKTAGPGQNPGGGGGTQVPVPSGQIGEMIQLWYDNAQKWDYGQGAGRLNPPESGYSDCSACIWWAVNEINPDVAENLGQWTGSMATSGTEIGRGTRNDPLPIDDMQPGDIVLIEWGYVNYEFNDVSSHVEWYVGDDRLWGAGYGPLPHDSGNATQYAASSGVGCWMVRRFMTEGETE